MKSARVPAGIQTEKKALEAKSSSAIVRVNAPGIISDFDNTFFSLRRSRVIRGVQPLFNAYLDRMTLEERGVHIVSARFSFLLSQAVRIVQEQGIEVRSAHGGNFLSWAASIFTQKYKYKKKLDCVRSILLAQPTKTFILFGDDGETDHDVYREIQREFPEQIRAVVLMQRRPEKRDVPETFIYQESYLDVGEELHKRGLLSANTRDLLREAFGLKAAIQVQAPAKLELSEYHS